MLINISIKIDKKHKDFFDEKIINQSKYIRKLIEDSESYIEWKNG